MAPVKNILDLAAPFQPWITAAALARGIRPALLNGVITQESFWNPRAIRGEAHLASASIGLGQLLPSTANMTPAQLRDPQQNIQATATYLAAQLQRYQGDEAAAVAAYNAGRAVRLQKGARFCLAWKSTAPKTGRQLDRDCERIYVAPFDGAFGNQPHVDKVMRYVKMFEDAARTDPRFRSSANQAAKQPATSGAPPAAGTAPLPAKRSGNANTLLLGMLASIFAAALLWWRKGGNT